MAWIARDENGYLYLHQEKPFRFHSIWNTKDCWFALLTKNFDSMFLGRKITWEDEPIEIEIKEKTMETYNQIIEHNVKAFVRLDKDHMDIVEEILGDYGFEECEYEHVPNGIIGDFVFHGENDDHWYSYGEILLLLEDGSMTSLPPALLSRLFTIVLENDEYYKKHNIK